jgi:hypothetical protein
MRQVGGYLAVAVGLFFGLGVLLNLGGPHPVSALVLSFLLFGAAPVALGVWLLRPPAYLAARLPAADQAWESELLRLAARRHGSLSVAEVVAHTDLDAAQAEMRLDAMCQRGLCELRVSDHGVVLYRFDEAPTAEHKRLAQGVFDE